MIPPQPRRPCPQPEETLLCALADFDAVPYGKEYLRLLRGDIIAKLPTPEGIHAEGWAYGRVGETTGWFPPHYAA